jgi:hypothetical protein
VSLKGLLVVALIGTTISSCSHGLKLDNGSPQLRTITHINFLFTDEDPSIALPNSAIQDERLAENVQPSSASPSTPTTQIALATNEIATTSTGTQSSQENKDSRLDHPENKKDAQAFAIPISDIAPSLQLFVRDSDPRQHVSTELVTASGLVSYHLTGAQRDPTITTTANRPLHVVQRISVHSDDKGASMMYALLKNEATPSYAKAAIEFFREPYPDLATSSRSTSQFNISEENHLFEIRIDPQKPVQERLLGPGEPHVYYLVLREGNVTALIELFYLQAQAPDTVAILGKQFVQRVTAPSQPGSGA